MTDATPNPVASTVPMKKRHPAERFLVWGGILVLLALLGWEWSARNGYERSMHDVEEAVRTAGDKELTPEDTKQYVHGYAVWGETTHLNSRLITLKWPSLFKKYQFNMALDGNGVVRGVETELPVADAMDPMVHSMEAAAMSATRPAATEAPAEGTEATPPADAAEATAAAPESDSK